MTAKDTTEQMQRLAANERAREPMEGRPINGLQVERVPIDSVQPHPKNARKGDMDVIAGSLQEHGQFRALVVQRSSGHIVAGNHTWLAAKERLHWTEVDVTYVDVDDERALKILAVDNRTSDLAGYDDKALLALLREIDDLTGTGWSLDDMVELTRITGDLGREKSSFLDDLRGPDPEPAGATGRNHFQLTFPCTEEERDQVNRVLRKIQSDRQLGSSVEALVWLAGSYTGLKP